MTSSTDDKRAASSAPRGTSNGTRASRRVRFARTMRWATVGSGTRNARAISVVSSPPSKRSVSATRASGESTGWQAMKMRRRRSSPTSSRAASRSTTALSCWASNARPSSSCLRSDSLIRRSRSMARCFAVAMSQAPGLFGIPVCGHRSSAITRASCARSSATPTSRTIRVSPAMSRADSILQTASMARWVSDMVITTHERRACSSAARMSAEGRLAARLVLLSPRSHPVLLLPELGGELGAEVLGLEHRANLDLRTAAEGCPLEPLDGLFHRPDLPDPVAGDELLGLGEGPVDHGLLVCREPHALPLGARVQSLGRQHHARPRQLFVVLTHFGEELLAGHRARLALLARLHQYHHSHRHISFRLRIWSRASGRIRSGG